MARSKEFDRDEAVKRAMAVFWEKGYEATSTDDLLRAMGIGRQSMYDTFGDKHRLYLEALQRYQTDGQIELFERFRASASPLAELREFLVAISNGSPAERMRGCLAVNAATEFGRVDPEVAMLIDAGTTHCEAVFARVVQEAKKKGEVGSAVDERAAARFIHSTIRGLRVSAKAGASREALRDIASFAIAGLKGA
ncbi:TetR/AcrR family transcriptional regulator [Hyalangium rubrum]|uniref:TetR/AcrR family transcriptional regulator n=1 Tax=Hyalangium rubrum TaxID=3103134 RepID=A0ABU5GYI8_9BACT|nr:TetR/AcrR family transcriptional regulator [Hyalangium sp. s54d21]MDY7225568.1 TetR/AcrR family transcriptional regulator [Hyalangium sp. s54d21]